LIGIVDDDDIGVSELSDGAGLALEADVGVGPRHVLLANDLESDNAAEALMPRLEDCPHAALADALLDDVWAEDEIIGASLKDLVDLVGRQPAALHQLAGQPLRVGELSDEAGQTVPVR